jgi:hypothetical protein
VIAFVRGFLPAAFRGFFFDAFALSAIPILPNERRAADSSKIIRAGTAIFSFCAAVVATCRE